MRIDPALDRSRIVGGCLSHFVAGIEPAKFVRESLAEREAFGALRQHHIRHHGPHARRRSVLFGLSVGLEAGNSPARLLEIAADHANPRGNRRRVSKPYVAPLAIHAAPERADLSCILAGAL